MTFGDKIWFSLGMVLVVVGASRMFGVDGFLISFGVVSMASSAVPNRRGP